MGELVDSVPEYFKTFAAKGRYGDYTDAWNVVQNGVVYVKIDDDVVCAIHVMLRKVLIEKGVLRRPHDWSHSEAKN